MSEDRKAREKWILGIGDMPSPQWQTNLLERFPRPIAVLLIVLKEMANDYTDDTLPGAEPGYHVRAVKLFVGAALLIYIIVVPGISKYPDSELQQISKLWVNTIIILFAIGAIFDFVDRYQKVNTSLPRRKKKDDG